MAERETHVREVLSMVGELKSIHQTIGGIGVLWRRCKPGTKRFVELERRYDELMQRSSELSDKIYEALLPRMT